MQNDLKSLLLIGLYEKQKECELYMVLFYL